MPGTTQCDQKHRFCHLPTYVEISLHVNMVVFKKETKECLRLVGEIPEVSLAAEEGGESQCNVTLMDSCQGVHWHSVAAEDAHIAHHHHWPSAPLLLHSVTDKQKYSFKGFLYTLTPCGCKF